MFTLTVNKVPAIPIEHSTAHEQKPATILAEQLVGEFQTIPVY